MIRSMHFTPQNYSDLPTFTGCYIFKNTKGEVIYIGKAKNISARVRQYFAGQDNRWTVQDLVKEIATIEYIQTPNQAEALILEANLVKKYQPKYNRMLKDGHYYSWIYIDTKSDYPTLIKTRKLGMPGKYFGPYPDAAAVRGLLRYIRTIFPYSTCQKKNNQDKACLHYHMGWCLGVCTEEISPEEYHKKVIRPIINLLNGKKRSVVQELQSKMADKVKEQEFEEAAQIRDRLYALEYLGQNLYVKEGVDENQYLSLKNNRNLATLKELSQKFKLKVGDLNEMRIEAYDITHLQEKGMYGSMVVGIGGVITKDHYRVFKIRDVKNNDPAALGEVLHRRWQRYIKRKSKTYEDVSFSSRPDIVLIDGAGAQVKAVYKVIQSFNANEKVRLPQIIGISKGKHFKRRNVLAKDEFWYYNGQRVVQFNLRHPYFLQQLRDEAHRFSRVWLHRQQRKRLRS